MMLLYIPTLEDLSSTERTCDILSISSHTNNILFSNVIVDNYFKTEASSPTCSGNPPPD